ncbi:MAG: FHA domain-containing protein [Acidobacteria bacterium]|nr:FHA domain-containing protein [Acidobacteriota bacterium]
MGVENVPLKNPMDNPEEWIEKVIAELSSVEPEEAAVSPESAEHSMPAGNAEHEEAGLHGLPDSAVAAVAEATGSAVIPEVIPDPIPDREEAALRFERLRKEHLPKGMFAHFLLTDIQAPVREMRGIPRYLRLEACCTVIGRHAGARIFLDDEKTVEPMHARVVYEQREKSAEFVLYPLKGAPVLVNGREIPSEGVVCNSGDGVQIGSAHLIFFAKNTAESAGARTG